MSTISTGTRQELVRAVADRYQQGTAAEKRLILDEFVALTGYHRKHAVRVLNGTAVRPRARRGRPCVYDSAVTEGLIVLWEASDRMCGKRLKALLPTLVPALEQHGHLSLDPAVRERLLTVSAATIDRRLASARAVTAGQRRRRRAGLNGLRSSVPVRTFGDWGDPAPGFVEVDLVAHCGGTVSGSFVWTLTLTDIASGWTECVPLLVREARLVVDALDQLRGALPFPLRGIDTDNGSEFLNEVLVAFCREQDIELTRSRPFRKNDQAWVEQKNGAVVRRLVGYGRLEGVPAAEALARLYSAAATVRERVSSRRSSSPRRPAAAAGFGSATTRRRRRARGCWHRMRFPSRRRTDFAPCSAHWTRSRCWTRSGPFSIISLPSPQGRRSIRCQNATPTSTGSCGASRSPGAPARCGRHIGLGRDHPDTGALGRIRSRRSGPASSSGWRPNRIGPRKSSSTASAGNSPGRSSPASFAPCSAASATGVAWPPVVSSSSIRRRHPQTAFGSGDRGRRAERCRSERGRHGPNGVATPPCDLNRGDDLEPPGGLRRQSLPLTTRGTIFLRQAGSILK